MSGSGSTWNDDGGPVNVGYLGNGSLTIDHGGQASAGVPAAWAAGSGASGTIFDRHRGAAHNHGPPLIGGNGNMRPGPDPPRWVLFFLRDRGSVWTSAGIKFGAPGQGTLTIQNGGIVNNTSAYIGFQAGS